MIDPDSIDACTVRILKSAGEICPRELVDRVQRETDCSKVEAQEGLRNALRLTRARTNKHLKIEWPA